MAGQRMQWQIIDILSAKNIDRRQSVPHTAPSNFREGMVVTAPESKAAKAPATKPGGGDAAALEDAFALYQAELLGTLFYLVGNLEDARDALQEAFIKCWRSHEKLVEVQNLKAWIFRIALNTGRDIRETAWRRKRQSMGEDESMIASQEDG